jgi:PST family polysaccharide transporter
VSGFDLRIVNTPGTDEMQGPQGAERGPVGTKRDYRANLYWNTVALTSWQFLGYFFPFVTIPYLVKNLGTSGYGKVVLAQSVCAYALIAADFGFALYGTHIVAENTKKAVALDECVSGILLTKVWILICCLAGLVSVMWWKGSTLRDMWLYLASFGVVASQTMFPRWFFQGVERMKFVLSLDTVTKAMSVTAILLFVRHPQDYVYVPTIYWIGAGISLCGSLIIIKRVFGVRLRFVSSSSQLALLKGSSQYFLSRISSDGLQNTLLVLIGWRFGSNVLGQYSLVERIYSGLSALATPLVSALYPYMIKHGDIALFKRILKFGGAAVLGSCLILVIEREIAIRMIYHVYSHVMSMLSLVLFSTLPISIVSSAIGYPLLGAFGHVRSANISLVASAAVTGLYILLVLFAHFNALLLMCGLAVNEVTCLIIRGFLVGRFGLMSGDNVATRAVT